MYYKNRAVVRHITDSRLYVNVAGQNQSRSGDLALASASFEILSGILLYIWWANRSRGSRCSTFG